MNSNNLDIELGLATNQAAILTWDIGTDVTNMPWGLSIIPEFNETSKLYRISSPTLADEPNFGIAMTVVTKDDKGRTTPSRKFVFFCIPGVKTSYCKKKGLFDAYLYFDIIGMPTSQPTVEPSWSFKPTSSPSYIYTTTSQNFVTF